ncbi:MAG: protein translocase SEC61 complex subunit gamma [Candidatus ainarchaeum sp.]|nr:protein translocase SEC61 complex subunit gamma [Candidatus ainarchaeum sp.]
MNIKELFLNFISDSKRIFIVSRKPTKDEYKKMLIIIGIGIIVIGVIGFVIQLIFNLAGLVGI